MRRSIRAILTIRAALIAATVSFVPAVCAAGDWTDPTPDELAMTKSQVEPGADAEALLWEVTVDDSPSGHAEDTTLDHYVRVKIFTAAGAERFSTVAIRHSRRTGISLVSARSVAPDGVVSALKGNAVFKTTDVKSSEGEVRSTTFAIPNVKPGSIVEYRYRETRYDWVAHDVFLPLQLDIPAREVRYNIKPIESPSFDMRYVGLNHTVPPFRRRAGGFYTTSVTAIPAFVEEPYMPPRDQILKAILVYYAADEPATPEAFWKDAAERGARWFDDATRPNKSVRETAESVAGRDGDAVARLRKLFDWCRRNVTNRSNDELEGRPVETEKTEPNRNAADVLAHRAGTEADVNLLFGSLARAAGFEVRMALAASRNKRFFDPSLKVAIGLDHTLIAVRLNDAWVLFDPGSRTVPFGGLRWPHEGSSALLCDRDGGRVIDTPLGGPEANVSLRTAQLALDAEGTLEGDVHVVYMGHANDSRRRSEADETLQQRQQDIEDGLIGQWPTAEVSDVRVATDLPDTTLRYEAQLHVRIPEYATRAGSRLLVQPAVFRKGVAPVFTAGKRRHPICFAYPWAEADTVRIRLPEGFVVESAEQPKPLDVPGVGTYLAAARLSADAREIVYVRQFRFGDGGTICFPKDSYASLRSVFDLFHERDEYTLTLCAPGDE